jgi:hypothetical protein
LAFANGKVIHILRGLPITIFFFRNPKKNTANQVFPVIAANINPSFFDKLCSKQSWDIPDSSVLRSFTQEN